MRFTRYLAHWHRRFGEAPVTTAELSGVLRLDDARLARALRRAHGGPRGRSFDGYMVRRAGFVDGLRRWRVVRVTP